MTQLTPGQIKEAIVIAEKCGFVTDNKSDGSVFYMRPDDFKITAYDGFRDHQLKFHTSWDWFHWAWMKFKAETIDKPREESPLTALPLDVYSTFCEHQG